MNLTRKCLVPVHQWNARRITRNFVKGLNLARTVCSKAQSTRSQPLVFSRLSSNLPPNEGLDDLGNSVGNTSQSATPEADLAIGTPLAQLDSGDTPFLPIPTLPPAVSGYPTPWISKEDYRQYLVPLYSRGWGVSFKMPKGKELSGHIIDRDGSNTLSKPRPTANLVVRYKFDNYNSAITFMNGVAGFANSENHHPRILTIENGRAPSVALVTQTDSAIRPAWNQPKTRRIRGITRRDLRLAVLVETLYTDEHGGGEHMRSVRPPDHQPSWDHFLRRLQGSSLNPASPSELDEQQPTLQPIKVKCYACGGPHRLDKCLVRQKYPPPNPCGHCQGNHWARDCPKLLRGMYQCRICGMNHPTEVCPQNKPLAPCPHCGGNHWLIDCQKQQFGDKIGQEMVLPLPDDK